jgi:DNA-binding beta-propeller fold protein YncE
MAVSTAQAATYSLGANTILEGPSGGSDSVVLSASDTWTATANAVWLHLSTANQSGMGSTNVVFSFDANLGATRTGTLTIAGLTLTVTQAGSNYIAANPLTTMVSSGLYYPQGMAVDGAGNVYIADTYNNAIKEWIAASNTVITLVSSGLNHPYGVAVDGAGNVYIADTWDNAIKQWIAVSNTVITLVSSGLNSPSGVAVDSAGNVYIADTSNNAIKKWIAASTSVTTLVSSGLNTPSGIALDAAGNVYIADTYSDAVKEWTVASNTVTTLVSSGSSYSYPYGVAVDGAGNVYFTDLYDYSLKEWAAASNIVTTLVPMGFSNPYGVAVDGTANVYFTGKYQNAVYEMPHAFIDPTAKTETAAAGNDALPVVLPATASLAGAFGPASDSAWLTLTGVTNGVVNFAFSANNQVNRTAHIALLGQSIAVTQLGPSGYFALGTTNLLEGPLAGEDSVVLAANSSWTATTSDSWLHLAAANQSGTDSTNVIFTFDGNPGATRTGTLTIAGLPLTVTQAGSTYVAANPVTALVSSGLSTPYGVAVDGLGNVYIADSGNNAVKEWIAASNAVITLVSSGLNSPQGVAVDGLGNVYIADSGNNAVKEWIAASNTVTTLVSSGLNSPFGVAVDGIGNVYIDDMENNAIKEWSVVNGTVITLVSSGLNLPQGIAVDGVGNVYIADTDNNAIKEWIAASDSVTTLGFSGSNTPRGVALDGSGNIYFTDAYFGSVNEWVAASNTVITVASNGLYDPGSVAVDGTGNVYIADTYNQAIKELPHVFMDPTPKVETPASGSDAFVLLPGTANLTGPFAPISDSAWLNITGVTNGVVDLAFTANNFANRMAHIALLGQSLAVAQMGPPGYSSLGLTHLLEGPLAGSDGVLLTANGGWTASTSDSWLHLSVTNQTGTGNADVVFTFDANPGATRTGTLNIAGLTLTVTQAPSNYVAAGSVTLVPSGLSYPYGVVPDGAGNVYIADSDHRVLKEWMVASNSVTTLVPSGLTVPFYLAVDGAGNVYISDFMGNAIKEWIPSSNTLTTLVSSNLTNPSGVAVDSAGNIYIGENSDSKVKKWTIASKTVSTLLSSGLSNPYGVAVDVLGNVYIADSGNNAIKELMASGNTVTALVSTGLTSPSSVAVDGSGNVYFADTDNNAIKEWIAASNTVTTLSSKGFSYPYGVAVDGTGNIFIADTDNQMIKEIPRVFVNPTSKAEGPMAGSDTLPAVVPATANLTGPYAPVSDSAWLTITGVTNGVVSFAFTANTSATSRTSHITLLGQALAVIQAPVTPPVLTGLTILNSGAFQFSFSNNQGASFTILTTTNLSLPLTNWTVLGALSNNGSGQYQFTDLTATNSSQRFYRVRSP